MNASNLGKFTNLDYCRRY